MLGAETICLAEVTLELQQCEEKQPGTALRAAATFKRMTSKKDGHPQKEFSDILHSNQVRFSGLKKGIWSLRTLLNFECAENALLCSQKTFFPPAWF